MSVVGHRPDLRPSAHRGRRPRGRHRRRRGVGARCAPSAGPWPPRGDADGDRPQELAEHRGLRLGRRTGLRPGGAQRAVGVHRSGRRLHAAAGHRGRPAVRRGVVAAGPRPRLGPHVHQPGRRLPRRDRVAAPSPSPSFADGLAVQRVLAAIEESAARSGQRSRGRWRSSDGRAVHPVHRPVGRPDPRRGRRAGGRLGLRRPRDRRLRASTSTPGAGTTRTTSPSGARSSTSTASASGRSPTT